jgi:hypothetical protein
LNTQIATRLQVRAHASARAWAVTLLGPLTTVGGIVWAFLQPWRVTLLHPHGQGYWWLVIEPPLLVALVGLGFALLVAPGLVEDLQDAEDDAAAR